MCVPSRENVLSDMWNRSDREQTAQSDESHSCSHKNLRVLWILYVVKQQDSACLSCMVQRFLLFDVIFVKSYEVPSIVATGLFRANFACRKQTDEIVKHFSGIP